MLLLLFFYLGSGALLAILSVPLLLKKIKPNPLYGFRVNATMNDPGLWYESNHYIAKWQLAISAVVILTSTGFYFYPGISVDAYALICLGVFGLVFLVAIIMSVRFMNKLRNHT